MNAHKMNIRVFACIIRERPSVKSQSSCPNVDVSLVTSGIYRLITLVAGSLSTIVDGEARVWQRER